MSVPDGSDAETIARPTLSIRTFGGVSFALCPAPERNGRVPSPAHPLHFGTRTAQALLLYLACQGRAVSRDGLAELLWPERTQEQARANLRLALHRLRRQIEPFLSVTRQDVGLNGGTAIDFDVAAFEKHLAAGQPEQATACYRGDFLDGFYLDDSPLFEQWALLERERLRTLALAAWQGLMDERSAAGQLHAAIDAAQRLLQLDPLHEASHRQLMRLLAQTGQRGAALAHYESLRRLLHDELDAPPDAATTELAEEIRAGEPDKQSGKRGDRTTVSLPPLLPLSRSSLPPQPTPFIGREAELAQIETLLANPDCRLLTLLGVGGIGKTRLALEAARRLLESASIPNPQSPIPPNGVCFVPLAPVEESELLPVAIAQALGLPNSGGDPLAQISGWLQGRSLLLILDNFEQVMEGGETVAELLRAAPGLKILLTSRQRLGLLEEWLLPVGGLSSRSGLGDEAGQLFLRSARRVKPDFAAEGQEEAIAAICRQVEGMPLALELAATWVRVMPCAGIAHQIGSDLNFLSSDLRNLPERHRSLRAVFDQSWRLLSAQEQELLSRVTLFRGGWALDEAAALAQATPLLLGSLVDKGLLSTDARGRFAIHELVRQYAAAHLAAGGEADDLRRRHFALYLALARWADAHLRGPAAAHWYARLDAERDNFRAAWEWALTTGHWEEAAWLGVALSHFWSVYVQFQESLFWLEQLLPQRQTLPHELRLAVLLGLYHFWRGRDDFASIDRHMDELRQLEAGSANPSLRAVAWRCMAVASADVAQAMACWEHCIGLLREADDPQPVDNTYSAFSDSGYQLAFALFRYAIRLIDTGDYPAAERIAAESLALFRRRENRDYIVEPLCSLGRLALLRGDLAQARLLLQEGVAIARGIGNVLGLNNLLPRLGAVALYSGKPEEARRLLHESLHLSQIINSAMYLAWSYTYLADTALWQGELEEAARWLAEALAHHARPRWVRTETVDCLWVAARLAAAQEEYRRAATLFGLAEEAHRQVHYVIGGPMRALAEDALATVQAALDPAVFAEAFAAGQQSSVEQALSTLVAASQAAPAA